MSFSARDSSFCYIDFVSTALIYGKESKNARAHLLRTQATIPHGSLAFALGQSALQLFNFLPISLNECVGIDNFLLDGVKLHPIHQFLTCLKHRAR